MLSLHRKADFGLVHLVDWSEVLTFFFILSFQNFWNRNCPDFLGICVVPHHAGGGAGEVGEFLLNFPPT